MATKKTQTEAVSKKDDAYEHYVRPVQPDPQFEEHYKLEHKLIKSYEELMFFYKNKFKPDWYFAWDTETSSLSPEQGAKTGDLVEGIIVGYSFTQDGHTGYYVPLSHPDYAIGYRGLKVLYAMACRSKLNLLYNCRFDMRFLEFMTPEKYGYTPEPDEKIYPFDLSKIKYFDVQASVWLADTNIKMPSLKKSEKHYLGWVAPTFEEITGSNANFGYMPAESGYRYASLDALGTFHLYFKTERYYKEAGAAGKLDNDVLYPLMWLENTEVNVDHAYLKSMRGDVTNHLKELKNYLFTEAGTEYNINSGRELVTIFHQMGIDTGARTSTGIMKTDIKSIENYLVEHKNNTYLNKLIEYKKLFKFDNSYLEKLISISDPVETSKHPIRFCYFTSTVPTGRLAAGSDGKNKFFAGLNVQSLPKPHSHNYHCHKATPEQIERGEDLCGWIFDDNPEGSVGLTEGQDSHLNVRKAFKPIDKGSVIVSVDMCLEAGSPVQTKRGYVGIGELGVGDEVLTPQGYVRVISVRNTGIKPLYKVKTDGQSIYCSEDHPFMIGGEQVKASDIKETLPQHADEFYSYVEGLPDDKSLKKCFKYIRELSTLKDKAEYVNSHNLNKSLHEYLCHHTRSLFCEMCGVKLGSSNNFLRSINLPTNLGKSFSSIQKQHVFNPFNTERSTPTSAYLLGYILGDGNISIRKDRKYKTLNIRSKDYSHLRQISYVFGGGVEIKKHVKMLKKEYTWWSIDIVDQSVCDSILSLGISPRKSFSESKINFSYIGDNLSHFLRGLLDSDGCIRLTGKDHHLLDITIAGNFSYMKDILCLTGDDWSMQKHNPSNSLCILYKKGTQEAKKDFYNYLYKGATLWLQRKRDIYDAWLISRYGCLPSFEMYDITIDSEEHVYYCSAILTHNCAEEIRVAANVYKEPVWTKAFNTGQDIHRATAIKIFGEENYCKEARKKAKCANFGILYGSSAYGFHNQFPDMTLEECEDFIRKFKKALPSIEVSQQRAVNCGRKNGFVKTYFGRPRRVKYYMNHPSRSMQGFGRRTCLNTQIQGCAGDILKLMLIRLYNELFVPYKDRGVSFVCTIHDEINYVVPKHLLKEVVPIIMRCQTIKLPDWEVPLIPDLSIGRSFGELIPFEYDEATFDGTFTPQMESIKKNEPQEQETAASPTEHDKYTEALEHDEYDYLT